MNGYFSFAQNVILETNGENPLLFSAKYTCILGQFTKWHQIKLIYYIISKMMKYMILNMESIKVQGL